ncbi:MAG TPA: DNA mismatch repair protein MutL, partial [Thermomicrobiales bacterium]|nr:DNA mismatch repair protein MutL [Thermomicrobiales bacterium]
PRGTTVTVRHLFQRVPARLSACASTQAELTQIGQTVRRLALAAPRVRMALFVEDRLAFQTTGSGDLQTALIEVYGPALAERVLPLGPVEVDGATISGVVAGPEVTRSGRSQVNLIVNGRWVQPRGLLHQLEAAYRPVLPRGRHPILALRIEVAPERVDINIHPSKLEVRVVNERAIAAAAGQLIRDALGRRPISLQLMPTGVDALPGARHIAEDAPAYDDDAPIITPNLPPLRLVGQVQDRLMLLEAPDGFYLVDQHRAHERVLFDRFTSMQRETRPDPIALPEPLLLELRPAQVVRFSRRLEELAALGFDCEAFGGRTFLIRRAPILPGMLGRLTDPDDVLGALRALPEEEPGEGEDWRERLLVNLACRTAVRRGRPLERPAMRGLVETLGHVSSPAVCPHGSPLLMHVSGALLEKQFGW